MILNRGLAVSFFLGQKIDQVVRSQVNLPLGLDQDRRCLQRTFFRQNRELSLLLFQRDFVCTLQLPLLTFLPSFSQNTQLQAILFLVFP